MTLDVFCRCRPFYSSSKVGSVFLFFFLQNGADGQPASVTCETLENVYLADRDTEVPFGTGKHQYVLHFKGAAGTGEMYQQNVKFKTKHKVRRRPRFVSAHDVEVKLKRYFGGGVF